MNGNLFRVILFVLLLAPFGGVSAQKLAYAGRPVAARLAGYERAHCVSAGRIARVCKANDERTEDGESVFLIERNGKTVGTIKDWRDVATTKTFHVFSGDLDKNGSAELVVVDFDGQSLGMGVSYYTVKIFPDFETRGFQTPLSFPTVEFGTEGSFVFDAKANETQILLGEWRGYDHLDSPRAGGVYFVGRYFRYRNGKLNPVAGKPVFARRYLNSFERERGRIAQNPRAPLAWFASPQTKRLTVDPEFTLKADSTENGTIEKFETIIERAVNADNLPKEVVINQILVRLDSGKTMTFLLSKSDPNVDLPSDKNRIPAETFGVLPFKIALPVDLSPTVIFDRFEGRTVRIDTFKPKAADGETPSDPVYKLWFVEE